MIGPAYPFASPFAGMLALAAVRTRASYSRIVFATSLGLAATLLALNAVRPEGSELPIRSPLFTIAVMYGLMPNSTFRQILPPLALSVALVFLRLTWLTGTATSDITGDIIILMVLTTAGVLMVRRRRALERDLDQAWQGEIEARNTTERAMADLKTLHGIIPDLFVLQEDPHGGQPAAGRALRPAAYARRVLPRRLP